MGAPNIVLERPRWARRELALALTGVSEPTLLRLVNDGHVRARKMGDKPKCGCVFCVRDIEEWLETDAPTAGPFALPGDKREE